MNPKSIVFLGGSNSIQTAGTSNLLNIVRGGYQGKVYPVHLREKTVLGLKAYPDIASLPEPADLAVLVIPNEAILKALEACGKKGTRHAIVITAGYGEMGSEGEKKEQQLVEIARKLGIRLLGPNCIGIINCSIGLNTTWFTCECRPGKVGIISQSGSYVTQTPPYFAKLGLGFSKAISVGNQADIDLEDCLDYLGQDPETGAIALYIEGLKRPRRFLELARSVASEKPIVALYVGGTAAGARASSSHTGSLSGPDLIYNALFRQSGVIRAQTVSELFDWAQALAQQPLPPGNRMAILTNSGGPGASMADECNRCGLEVPPFDSTLRQRLETMTPLTASTRNPVDLTMNYDLELIYVKLPSLLLNLEDIDGMLFYGIFGPIHFRRKRTLSDGLLDIPVDSLEKWIRETCGQFVQFPNRYGKPILCSCFSGQEDAAVQLIQEGGIPVFPTPERAVRAMAALWKYQTIRGRFEKAGRLGESGDDDSSCGGDNAQ
jgi:acetyltransferase